MTKAPSTPAIRVLKAAGIPYGEHLYAYVDRGGTTASARALGVAEHAVIKTLVMEDEAKRPLLVLMHGDCEVSTKELARQIGSKSLHPCAPEVAQKHSGYQVGGTSPFGTKKALPIYVEASILELERLWINGGARGFLVSLKPQDLERVVSPIPVQVALR